MYESARRSTGCLVRTYVLVSATRATKSRGGAWSHDAWYFEDIALDYGDELDYRYDYDYDDDEDDPYNNQVTSAFNRPASPYAAYDQPTGCRYTVVRSPTIVTT